jgi:glycosyltransferase involved in cell wall biosynthesis
VSQAIWPSAGQPGSRGSTESNAVTEPGRPRVAIVHDYLTQRGGAERVVLSMLRAFPDAPLYTSVYDPEATYREFQDFDVRPLWTNRIGPLRSDHRRGVILYPAAFASLHVDADVVVCSTTGFAHGVRTSGRKLVYCNTPPRWLYEEAEHYLRGLPRSVRTPFAAVAPAMRWLDRRAAQTADVYFGNSALVVDRIHDAYGIDAVLLHPPVTQPSTAQRPVPGIEPGFVLSAARMLPYKNVDATVKAFAALPDERLVVVGDGPMREELERLATPNVTFLGTVKGEALAWLYQSCAGLVAASREDFGLTPLEAASYGRPSAVLRFGGFLETVIDGATGLFFDQPSEYEIASVVKTMLRRAWDPDKLIAHAATFSEDRFVERFRNAVTTAAAAPPRRPRVALVAHDIHDGGGMERACAELIRRTNEDVRFTVVSSQLAPDLRPLVDRWVRIPVPRRPMPLKFATFYLLAGLALLRVRRDLTQTVGAIVPGRVDIASIHFCHAGFRAATASQQRNAAPLLRRLNTKVLDVLSLAAERWSYRPGRVRTLAAVSTGLATEVARFYLGIPVAVTPNGVDATERFHPDQDTYEELRESLGVGNELVLLFVGGDWDRKGVPIAIEALGLVGDAFPCRLWVVGKGDAERFANIAKRFGVAERVSFFGTRSDAERFYQAADVFVLPSQYETFSLAAFEAAACGLPVVITPIQTAEELVGDEEAGHVVHASAAAIARALEALNDAPTRRRMGAAARARALAYSWEASASSVSALYCDLR